MKRRPHRGAERPLRSREWVAAALTLVCLVPAAAGCAPTVMGGRAASMLYEPHRVGGLHATDGLSGVRRDAPGPQGDVEGTDGGDDDHLALLAVNDIQDFWAATCVLGINDARSHETESSGEQYNALTKS